MARRQCRAGRRHRDRAGLRRSRPSRPRPHPDLGGAGRRQHPPDRPDQGRSQSAQRQRRRHVRPGACRGVPVEGHLEPAPRSRSRRRTVGAPPSPRRPQRKRPPGCRAIRRKATKAKLSPTQRKGADEAANYLTSKTPYLDYPTALASGWPIATGVIEGACRHIVTDRFDVTGARWRLDGAETILKLRALRSNRDFQNYWTWHLTQERHRVHETRYLDGALPRAA